MTKEEGGPESDDHDVRLRSHGYGYGSRSRIRRGYIF